MANIFISRTSPGEASGSGGTSDHGSLSGLLDNDHPQYALTGSDVEFNSVYADIYSGVWIAAGFCDCPIAGTDYTLDYTAHTIDIAEQKAVLYEDGVTRTGSTLLSGWTSPPQSYTLPATTLSYPTGVTSYIVGDYSGGSPGFRVTQNVLEINESNVIPYLTIYHDADLASTLSPEDSTFVLDWDSLAHGLPNKLHQRAVVTQRFVRESGVVLDADTGYTVTIGSGVVWYGANRIPVSGFNSTIDTLVFGYHSGGSWAYETVTGFTDQYYDDGTDRQPLLNLRRVNNWIYRSVQYPATAFLFLGDTHTREGDQIEEQPPEGLPDFVSSHCILAGRIRVRRRNTQSEAIFEVDSAFDEFFTPATANDHNELANLQGGSAEEYYHLTEQQHSDVVNGAFAATGSAVEFSSVDAATITSGGTDLFDIFPATELTTNVLHVDEQGNDATADGTFAKPYKTLQAAIDVATTGQTVVAYGQNSFTENFTGKQGVNVYAPHSEIVITGTGIAVPNAGFYEFNEIRRESGTGPMVLTEGTGGYVNIRIGEVYDYGSGNTFVNGNDGILDLQIQQAYAYNGGFGAFVQNNETGRHIHFNADDLYLASSGAIGVQAASGGTILSNIQHLKEIEAGTGTSIAFDIQNGDVNVAGEDFGAATLAIIGDDGNLNMMVSQAQGDVINTGSGIYNAFAASKNGRTQIQSNLGIDQVAPSYRFTSLSGSAGSYLTIGANGGLVPVELNVGQVTWEDSATTVTTLDSTGTEILLYEITTDQDFSAGSWEYEVTFDIPYFRETIVRFYCGATLLSTVTENSGVDPLTISDAGAISSAVSSGTVFSATVETNVAPGFVPNRTTVTDGFIRVVKTGNEANAEWGSIGGDITTQTDLYDNFLSRDNTDVFSPTGDYNPATKKYVDDELGSYAALNTDVVFDNITATSVTTTGTSVHTTDVEASGYISGATFSADTIICGGTNIDTIISDKIADEGGGGGGVTEGSDVSFADIDATGQIVTSGDLRIQADGGSTSRIYFGSSSTEYVGRDSTRAYFRTSRDQYWCDSDEYYFGTLSDEDNVMRTDTTGFYLGGNLRVNDVISTSGNSIRIDADTVDPISAYLRFGSSSSNYLLFTANNRFFFNGAPRLQIAGTNSQANIHLGSNSTGDQYAISGMQSYSVGAVPSWSGLRTGGNTVVGNQFAVEGQYMYLGSNVSNISAIGIRFADDASGQFDYVGSQAKFNFSDAIDVDGEILSGGTDIGTLFRPIAEPISLSGDVAQEGATNGQVPTWDNGTGTWVPKGGPVLHYPFSASMLQQGGPFATGIDIPANSMGKIGDSIRVQATMTANGAAEWKLRIDSTIMEGTGVDILHGSFSVVQAEWVISYESSTSAYIAVTENEEGANSNGYSGVLISGLDWQSDQRFEIYTDDTPTSIRFSYGLATVMTP